MTNEYSHSTLATVLARWWDDASQANMEPHLAPSGLSGARVWRVTYHGRPYCLRRWPREHPQREQLAAIHGLLRHVRQQGIDFVPMPVGLVVADGHHWELSPWMPGEPYDREQPSRERLLEAMRCLARFHVAARSYPAASVGPAPGLLSRRDVLCELQAGGWQKLRQAVREEPPAALPRNAWGNLAEEMLDEMTRVLPHVLGKIEAAAERPLPLQWCLRDVKHDHVLFQGERLTGLIDFGAAAIDAVAGDVARLVGSMLGDARHQWPTAIDAYHAVRPLAAEERQAIDLFDAGGTLVATGNWLRWLYVDQRQFPNTQSVCRQLEWLHARLQALPC